MNMPTIARPACRRLLGSLPPFAASARDHEPGVTPQGWVCGPCTPTGPQFRCFTAISGRRICVHVRNIAGTRHCCFLTQHGRLICRTERC